MLPKVGKIYRDKSYNGIRETIFRITEITENNNYYSIKTEPLIGLRLSIIDIYKPNINETWLSYFKEIPLELVVAKVL